MSQPEPQASRKPQGWSVGFTAYVLRLAEFIGPRTDWKDAWRDAELTAVWRELVYDGERLVQEIERSAATDAEYAELGRLTVMLGRLRRRQINQAFQVLGNP